MTRYRTADGEEVRAWQVGELVRLADAHALPAWVVTHYNRGAVIFSDSGLIVSQGGDEWAEGHLIDWLVWHDGDRLTLHVPSDFEVNFERIT